MSLYRCKNEKEHSRDEWCGPLNFATEEQNLLSQYLFELMLSTQDLEIVQASLDLFWALRCWSRNWQPTNLTISYPMTPDLKDQVKTLLDRCQACCIPHSQDWCSASSCPSCCASELNKKFNDIKTTR